MKKFLVTASSLLFPSLVFAQVGNVWDIFTLIQDLLNTALPVIIAVAVVWFIFNVVKYVVAGDDAAKEQAKQRVIYGVIGLFIAVSVWGLVNILVNTFGLTNNVQNLPDLPN